MPSARCTTHLRKDRELIKNIATLSFPSDLQITKYKKVAVEAMRYFRVTRGQWVGGLCAIVTVRLWDLLGQPKDLVPYSCFVGEDEHVVLRSKNGWILDPTGDQFNYNFFSYSSEGHYNRFARLSRKEIQHARDEGEEYLRSTGGR